MKIFISENKANECTKVRIPRSTKAQKNVYSHTNYQGATRKQSSLAGHIEYNNQ